MLIKLERISGLAVFRDFRWGNLPLFGKYNLIYGANGSGKSTISKALRSISNGRTSDGVFRVAFDDGATVSLSDGLAPPFPISVFNVDFITENISFRQGASAQTLFYVGEASTHAREELDKAEESLRQARDSLDKARKAKKDADDNLKLYGTDTARVVRTSLTSAGASQYSSYERPQYFQAARKMLSAEQDNVDKAATQDQELLKARVRAAARKQLATLPDVFSSGAEIASEAASLSKGSVAFGSLQALLENPAMTTWLDKGVSLHDEVNFKECLFCRRLGFPSDRRDLLTRVFSEEYRSYQGDIEIQLKSIEALAIHRAELKVHDADLVYEEFRGEYQQEAARLVTFAGSFDVWLRDTRNFLQQLMLNPGAGTGAVPVIPELESSGLVQANRMLKAHNERSENIDEDRSQAANHLEAAYVAESLSQFAKLERGAKRNKVTVDLALKRVSKSEKEAEEWRSSLRSSVAAAKGLEDDVRHYLGHDELKVEVEADEGAFVITRGGVPASELSEGEMSAFALLYFLRSLEQDDGSRKEDRLVVLDDPVSSLDGNSLLAASEYIRERTSSTRQLVILTHNDSFFLDVHRWMNERAKRDGTAAESYMLNVRYEADARASEIVPLDPMLDKYRSMYMFAFSEMYRYRRSGAGGYVADVYRLPNLARRFLEQFCQHRFPAIRSGLGKAKEHFASEGLEEVAVNRLVKLLHLESHGIEEREAGLGLSRFEEVRNVVGDVLRLVELSDDRHFQALESIVLRQNVDLRTP